jgi:para-aminobenzoate synthetase / 4-amino-4-deoxychorismate lyase
MLPRPSQSSAVLLGNGTADGKVREWPPALLQKYLARMTGTFGVMMPLGPIMNGALPSGPFVLLDDARASGAAPARLYANPIEIIAAHRPEELAQALDRLGAAQSAGLHAAGFMAYEAGHALEPRLGPFARDPGLPLLWFGLFERYQSIVPDEVQHLLPSPDGGWAGAPIPSISFDDYTKALSAVLAYISAGDIYQANLTFACSVATAGHPLAIFAGLRERAKAGFGGVVWTGTDWLLSLSPELFFALHDAKVTTRPMKGTATRKRDPAADAAAIVELQTDPKQRAENLMIVDLLRNDLSRVAVHGTVEVPHLFTVETYPTVHTMTSTVTAQVKPDVSAVDVIKAIYPCGSITGAPKIRAMEVIHELEPQGRGAYTGSIGRIDPNGDAAFNVAIRTLHLPDGETQARMGLGGGIVADSRLNEEWLECLAKGAFVGDQRQFDLIETMRFDPAGGVALLERHLARMKASAEIFGFTFDRHAARNEMQAATFRLAGPRRLRLMLARSGKMAIEITPLHKAPDGPVEVALSPLPVASSDFRLIHKTTDRAFYEAARRAAGTFEVALVDPQGFVTEGSFTNIFVKRDGKLLTPPLKRGLLPGILRAELIAQDMAREADLRPEDLVDGFFIGNASRGLLPATLAPDGSGC